MGTGKLSIVQWGIECVPVNTNNNNNSKLNRPNEEGLRLLF